MLRRSLLCALILTTALVGIPASAMPPTTVAPAPTKRTETGFRVEYRRAGSPVWSAAGTYREMDRASAAANGLYADGHQVRVTRYETVTLLRPGGLPAPSPAPSTATKTVLRLPVGVSVVQADQMPQIFARMKAQKDIAFRYPTDGCYARAHLMGKRMMEMGLTPGKAWAFDDKAMDDKDAPPRMYARTTNHPRGEVWWKYHVAPLLGVRDNTGNVRMHVIDPSLFDEAVPLARWRARMTHPTTRFSPRLDVTAWEQAPRRGDGTRFPGKGYWPGTEPTDADSAARATMARFKPLQGTDRVLPTRVVSTPPATRPPTNPVGTRTRPSSVVLNPTPTVNPVDLPNK
jgi:hypothetical protein